MNKIKYFRRIPKERLVQFGQTWEENEGGASREEKRHKEAGETQIILL